MHRSLHALPDICLGPGRSERNIFFRHSEVVRVKTPYSSFRKDKAVKVVAGAGRDGFTYLYRFVNKMCFRRIWHISHCAITRGVGFVINVIGILENWGFIAVFVFASPLGDGRRCRDGAVGWVFASDPFVLVL